MTLKKEFDSESLKVKVKDDEVTITLRTKNWSGVYTELLRTMALDAKNHGISIADRMGHALKLESRDASSSQEEYDMHLRLCERLADAEQKPQNPHDDVGSNIGEPD